MRSKKDNLKHFYNKRVKFWFLHAHSQLCEQSRLSRDFLSLLSAPKISLTNPNCVLKTDVVCNRQPAQVKFSLIDSAQEKVQVKEIRFISENLTTLELLQLLNKHVSALAPVEEITSKLATKAEKQKLAAGGKKGSKRK
ncbi:PREDICTED: uncharacterized protein LOC108378732 isoform X2 [Rhagoletis zephyria]|uniref:uncharacterized protein LOC108378732 isoform X2 n=1 Tax=Rhagoletis zephyria TaxID=28612 RepID=UPI0008114E9D|nr:PREDICTED: uncharacterized protein LOC108378732 isoform X2 [Rhagoletis zephyria]